MREIYSSEANRRLRERTNGVDLSQFSMLTATQFAHLRQALSLRPGDRVLDAGCGVGRIAHTLASGTGARIVGVDVFSESIAAARAVFGNMVEFHEMDFDALPWQGPRFDAIYSIDTFYFSKDLRLLLHNLMKLLKPGGRLAVFWSELLPADGDRAALEADGTRLARALSEMGLPYAVREFTEEEFAFWSSMETALPQLRPDLIAEGWVEEVDQLEKETRFIMEHVRDGRTSRHFYLVKLPVGAAS